MYVQVQIQERQYQASTVVSLISSENSLVDEKTGQLYFHPKVGRPPKAKRSLPVSEHLYQQKDNKNRTINQLAAELDKMKEISPIRINKESEEMLDKAMSDALDDIFTILDAGKMQKITPNNCELTGI
jgi:hypothetical protein